MSIQRTIICVSAVVFLLAAGCGPKRFPWPLQGKQPADDASAKQVTTISSNYDRLRSRVLVRKITRATRANLDYAAYHANMMTFSPAPESGLAPAAFVPGPEKLFGGMLLPGSIVSSIQQTSLSAEERARPMAFSPLVDVLSQWNYDKASPLDDARTAVRSESWGAQKSIQVTYQEITDLYLHQKAKQAEWWVKIEFAPWARLFEDMPDEDQDGYPEIYARLKPDLIAPELMDYLQKEYAGKLLNRTEVKAWANELASYWYPSFNTDIFDMAGQSAWPVAETEKEVLAEIKGLKVDNPAVVMRGKPRGQALYNVFVVEGLVKEDKPKTADPSQAQPNEVRTPTVLLEPQKKLLDQQLEEYGAGSWEKWAGKVAKYQRRLKSKLAKRPKELKAIEGRQGFLFFRNSVDYVVGGDLQKQPKGKNPFSTIVDFKNYLEKLGVDFLLVPVPTKVEVFPDKILAGKFDRGKLPVLNPYGRKFLAELTEAGVEVVDLLPAYLKARSEQKKAQEFLYQPQDTHWTDRGLRLTARLIGQRIEKYEWYRKLSEKPVKYSQKKAVFKRHGDLVSRLAEKEKGRYKPQELIGYQVLTPQGELYDDDAASPVVVLGDSFTGVFQRTYCRNAGISAHIAKEILFPVDLVMSYGGGPNVRKKLLRRGEDALRKKRLVIWMFAARDLYNYWEDWEPLQEKKK
jgi:acetyltransferase AlgX (SGNH hydrolase-like protein)